MIRHTFRDNYYNFYSNQIKYDQPTRNIHLNYLYFFHLNCLCSAESFPQRPSQWSCHDFSYFIELIWQRTLQPDNAKIISIDKTPWASHPKKKNGISNNGRLFNCHKLLAKLYFLPSYDDHFAWCWLNVNVDLDDVAAFCSKIKRDSENDSSKW